MSSSWLCRFTLLGVGWHALRLLRAYSARRPVACSLGSAGDAELGEAVNEAMRARDVGNRAVDGGPQVWCS